MEIVNSLPQKTSFGEDIKNINNQIGNTDISDIGDGTITNAIDTLNTNLANQIASNDYRIYAITSATIAGNTDTSIIIDFAEITSYEIMNPVALIQGYEVTADWDTKLFIKQIGFDFATKKIVINVRTQGSTTQTYIISYVVFFQKITT